MEKKFYTLRAWNLETNTDCYKTSEVIHNPNNNVWTICSLSGYVISIRLTEIGEIKVYYDEPGFKIAIITTEVDCRHSGDIWGLMKIAVNSIGLKYISCREN